MTVGIDLLEAVPWLRAHQGQTFVVKVGGALAEAPHRDAVARDIAVLHRLGLRVVLVHGGGPQLDRRATELGLATERVAGRRVTSPALLEAAVREWRGRMSVQWVGALRRAGEGAVGLSGLDGGLVTAVRRPPALVADDDGERVQVDYGHVGDVESVCTDAARALLDAGLIPVICSLAGTAEGEPLNVNADTVAAELAIGLGATKLVLLTTAPGILRDGADPSSVLVTTDLVELDELRRQGALSGGMRPKVAALERALGGGVERAHVVDGRRAGALLEEIFTTEGSGTLVVRGRLSAAAK